MFSPQYERRWPRTTAALIELEHCCREFQRLRDERGEHDTETLAAMEAANLAALELRRTEDLEAQTAELWRSRR